MKQHEKCRKFLTVNMNFRKAAMDLQKSIEKGHSSILVEYPRLCLICAWLLCTSVCDPQSAALCPRIIFIPPPLSSVICIPSLQPMQLCLPRSGSFSLLLSLVFLLLLVPHSLRSSVSLWQSPKTACGISFSLHSFFTLLQYKSIISWPLDSLTFIGSSITTFSDINYSNLRLSIL